MVPQHKVDSVRRLLVEGRLSQRRIAKLIGISRATVGAIANGRRPKYPIPHRAENDPFGPPTGPPQRCVGCGGMVYVPCRLCYVRDLKETQRVLARRRVRLARFLAGYGW